MSDADETRRNLLRFALATGAAGVLLDSGGAQAAETDPELLDLFVAKNSTQPENFSDLIQWTIEPASSTEGRANFSLAVSNSEFEGIQDPLMFLGYNAEAAVGTGHTDEPMLAWAFEGFYRARDWSGTGVQQDTMEAYLEYRNADRSITNFRPIATTLGRDDNEARWATTHIDIGTDPSNFKSQFLVRGEDTLFKITNDVINLNRRLQVEGNPAYFNSMPPGQNAHVFFLQRNKLLWFLGNFIHDLNHYLWDQSNGRPHVTYVSGANPAAARTTFNSQVEVMGDATFQEEVSVTKGLTVTQDVTVGGDLAVTTDADVAGHLTVGQNATLAGDLAVQGGLDVTGDVALRSKVGFNDTAPIAQRPASDDATDLASAIALINELKADLVAYGLKASSSAPRA